MYRGKFEESFRYMVRDAEIFINDMSICEREGRKISAYTMTGLDYLVENSANYNYIQIKGKFLGYFYSQRLQCSFYSQSIKITIE